MKYIALILAISFAPLTYASNQDDYDSEAIIKYRQDTMSAIRAHNNAIKAIINGKVPYGSQLGLHMAALKDLFNQLNVLFPEGSDFGNTNAKDEIWKNPKRFRETVDKAREAFARFERVINSGNKAAAPSAFQEFGKASCGNCHKTFKKKEDDENHDHDHDHN